MSHLQDALKRVAALIPGTGAATAQAKRKMERDLRAQGYSRSEALRLTSKHFRHD